MLRRFFLPTKHTNDMKQRGQSLRFSRLFALASAVALTRTLLSAGG
jgi:hypothetical protein